MQVSNKNKPLTLNRMIVLTILFSVLCFLQFTSMRFANIPANIAGADSMTTGLFCILFSALILIIQRFYHTAQALNIPNISTILLFSALTLFLNYIICTTIYKEAPSYLQFVTHATPIKAALIILSFTLILLFTWIEQQKIQEQRLQQFAVQKEREALQIEFNSLEQQLKPHFLFNSLNSINALTITDPAEARKMIHLLSQFMRGSIRKNQTEIVTLKEEIDHIKLYTDIEKVRFGSRLNIQYYINDDFLDCKIPILILQPVIENAIKYGLYDNTEDVTISIHATLENNRLCITVTNPFDPTTSSGIQGTGFGLPSIEKKLMILYGQSSLLETEKQDQLFTTRLFIPQHETSIIN